MFTAKQFLEHFSEIAINDEVSLFLGAGISNSAGHPTWKSLLDPCAQKLGIEITGETDLFLLAQYYANTFGYNDLKKIINDNINSFNQESSVVNELLDLNFKSIWTTNYDTVIESGLGNRKIRTNTVFDDRDLANISKSNRVNIYKLNGDISNLEKIIITKRDLDQYENTHQVLLTFFKRELVSNTFLFLGYSFTDTLVLSCLNTLSQCLGESSNYHYTIMKKNETNDFFHFVDDLDRRYHIKTLLVDEYSDIPIILNKLNKKIREKRVFISGSFNTLNPLEDQMADKISKELTHSLLENKYRICSGMGYKLGNYICGYALLYLASKNIIEIERYLNMRPFVVHESPEDKKNHRTNMINSCNVSIFIFGKANISSPGKSSDGVWEEFEIAKANNRIIIPIGATGYASKEIWTEVKANITLYPYLEKYIDALNDENDVKKLTKVVMEILANILRRVS